MGSLTSTANVSLLRWGIQTHHAITIGQVVGSRLPKELLPVCNSTLILSDPSNSSFLAPDDAFFACASGLTPILFLPSLFKPMITVF